MKTIKTSIHTIAALTALSITAYAQNADNPGKGPGGKHRGSPPKMLLDQFDKDGDGKLSDEEKAEARKAMGGRRGGPRGGGEEGGRKGKGAPKKGKKPAGE